MGLLKFNWDKLIAFGDYSVHKSVNEIFWEIVRNISKNFLIKYKVHYLYKWNFNLKYINLSTDFNIFDFLIQILCYIHLNLCHVT